MQVLQPFEDVQEVLGRTGIEVAQFHAYGGLFRRCGEASLDQIIDRRIETMGVLRNGTTLYFEETMGWIETDARGLVRRRQFEEFRLGWHRGECRQRADMGKVLWNGTVAVLLFSDVRQIHVTMSIKTILVPYDFSECATDALRVAAKIARHTGACIDVVHLYEQMTDFHTENQRIREEIEAKLDIVPALPFLEGIELKKFMLRQMSLNEM